MAGDPPESEFTRADDALIGRCVRAFGHLEYALGSLLRCLYLLTPEQEDHESNKKKWPKIRDRWRSIERMAAAFGDEVASNADSDPHARAVYDKFVEVLKSTTKLRNAMVHGHWRAGVEDELIVEYWKATALKELGKAPSCHSIDPGDAIRKVCFEKALLAATAEYALLLADEMAEFEKTVRGEAAEINVILPDIPLIRYDEL